MRAVLLSGDLMLVSSAQGAADRHGVRLITAVSEEQALEAMRDAAARLVVIDLRLPGLDVAAFVSRVRSAKPWVDGARHEQAAVVACGPHVHEEALAAAAAAGCDEVITRGQFERRIDALLAELMAPAAKEARPEA
jgi:CheY-like chemotaxis protein